MKHEYVYWKCIRGLRDGKIWTVGHVYMVKKPTTRPLYRVAGVYTLMDYFYFTESTREEYLYQRRCRRIFGKEVGETLINL